MATLFNNNPEESLIKNPIENQQTHNQEMSDYEKTREERIKQNLNRMQKLGIFDLSLKLKSVKPVRKNNLFKSNDNASLSPPLLIRPAEPVRRSSRLQSTPVSYTELPPEKEYPSSKRKVNFYTGGSKLEEYTEEHEKLLGSTEMSWTLFVDGYGKDGKRIYDCVKGKTCHQCRQKTLGHRTHCSKCGMVQGQFCGDCLYMRYGENVLEASQNPDWICPVCRGICNCSLCRQAKGWAPTGILYKKITRLGFKSVAHYLIQTHRPHADSPDKDTTIEDDTNMKPSTENDLEQNIEDVKVMKQTAEKVKDAKPITEEVKDEKLENKAIFSEKKLDNTDDDDKIKGEVEKNHFTKSEIGNAYVAGTTSRVSKRKNKITCETGGESIAQRLRQRRRICN